MGVGGAYSPLAPLIHQLSVPIINPLSQTLNQHSRATTTSHETHSRTSWMAWARIDYEHYVRLCPRKRPCGSSYVCWSTLILVGVRIKGVFPGKSKVLPSDPQSTRDRFVTITSHLNPRHPFNTHPSMLGSTSEIMTCDWSLLDMVEDIVFVVCCVVVVSVRLLVDHLLGLTRGWGASTCIASGCCCWTICWCMTCFCWWIVCCCCCCWKGDLFVLFSIARSCMICAIVG